MRQIQRGSHDYAAVNFKTSGSIRIHLDSNPNVFIRIVLDETSSKNGYKPNRDRFGSPMTSPYTHCSLNNKYGFGSIARTIGMDLGA